MKKFLVFINNLIATHEHLYSIEEKDAETAKSEVWKEFDKNFAPNEKSDWRVTAFEITFTAAPQYVARVDKET